MLTDAPCAALAAVGRFGLSRPRGSRSARCQRQHAACSLLLGWVIRPNVADRGVETLVVRYLVATGLGVQERERSRQSCRQAWLAGRRAFARRRRSDELPPALEDRPLVFARELLGLDDRLGRLEYALRMVKRTLHQTGSGHERILLQALFRKRHRFTEVPVRRAREPHNIVHNQLPVSFLYHATPLGPVRGKECSRNLAV